MKDAIVIGAGVSGLAAAARLSGSGRSVQVVEARERVGGRIFTVRDRGVPIELGAEFVHGEAAPTVRLARPAGLRLGELAEEHACVRDGEVVECGESLERVERALANVRPPDRTFTELAEELPWSPQDREMARSFVEGFEAADPARISALALGGVSASRGRRFLDGYDALPALLAAQIAPGDLLLGRRVTAVRWKPGRVAVHTASLTGSPLPPLEARSAVITLPLGVLQHGDVRFDPALPSTFAAARRLVMGTVARMVLRFREPVLALREEIAGAGFLHLPGAPVPVMWTPAPVDTPLLTAWIGGPRSAHLDREDLLEAALASLATALRRPRETIEALLEAAHHHDWTRDPFTRGAYTYTPVRAADAHAELARPVAGTLFVAGEATCAAGSEGTVDGAIETGERAARELMAALP